MMEIKGQVNTAVCFAKVIEDEAIEQIRRMCDYELPRAARSASCLTSMPARAARSERP